MSAENKNEAVASSDVSTRISQQLAELDEAYLHRAEKYIELLLAEKAAETGDAEAQCRCGDMYFQGIPGETDETDLKKAFDWYKKAAEQGHGNAQYALGEMYMCGGVEADDEKAVYWYKKAAQQGVYEAMDALVKVYGDDTYRDHVEEE